jgi:site-specific DNA recombinase
VIARWITEIETVRAAYEAMQAPEARPRSLTRDQIVALVQSLAGLPDLLHAAEPADKADLYAGIGLRLTYHPQQQMAFAEVRLGKGPQWAIECVRGGT